MEELESITGFVDMINGMEVCGRSTRQFVTVRRSAGNGVRVRFEAGALSRLRGGGEVAEEIRSAIAAALADYDRQYFAARWRCFGSRLGDERVGER